MDQSTQNSERLTAILSTLLAVAILAAGVTAQQSRSTRTDELSYLESDLRFQLQAAYRLNPKEGEARLEQLESVLHVWRQAPRTEADERLLSTWLLEATIRSMPGSLENLPPAPQFGAHEPEEQTSSPPAAESPVVTEEPTAPARNLDILEEPVTPFVAGLTPDLAQPRDLTPDLAPTSVEHTPVEHTLVSVTAHPANAGSLPAQPVEINLTELAARIAGYHQGLSELESRLFSEERPQAEQLREQISELDALAKDFQFVQLYYESLSADERQAVEPPRSLEPLLDAARQQLERLQSDADGDFLGEYDAGLSQQVAELRGRLDAIAGRANW